MQQASQAQQAALQGTAGAGTILGSDIQAYQNPYTQQVINANTADIMRGAQMGLNALDTAAGRAGAFGGSRHGVAMSELGRGVTQQIGQQSAQLRQQGFMNAQQMAQQDIQNRMAQAAQLGALGQQSFGYGQQIQQGLAQQGAQEQALQQALIDAAKQQFAAYTGQPVTGLGYVSSALGATPVPQTQTTTKQPGLFDYLTLAASTAGAYYGAQSDIRLKKNIKKIGELANGLGVYTWEWKSKIKDMVGNFSLTKGVMAQEVLELIPDAVREEDNGYLSVNYAHPELKGAL